MCQSMVNIQSPTAEIRRGKKKKEEEEERNSMKILWSALLHRATIIRSHHRRTWTVQLYSSGGANVHPIYRKPKMVAMATSLSTYGPHPTRLLRPIRVHNPNSIPIGSAVFAQMTVECPLVYNGTSILPQKFAPSHGGIWTPI